MRLFLPLLSMWFAASVNADQLNVFLHPKVVCDANKCEVDLRLDFPPNNKEPIQPTIDYSLLGCDKNTYASFTAFYQRMLPGSTQTWQTSLNLPTPKEDLAFGIWMSRVGNGKQTGEIRVVLVGGEQMYDEWFWWTGCETDEE